MNRDEFDAHIEKVRAAVETIHRCKAVHEGVSLVAEEFEGKPVWEGLVQIFNLFSQYQNGKPPAKRCYAWVFNDGKEDQFVTVLEKPPVTDARTAVRAYVASLGKK